MFKYQSDYKKVEEMRKKFPELSNKELIGKAGVKLESYYKGKRMSQKTGKTKAYKRGPYKKPPYKMIDGPVAAPAKEDGRLIFLMGTPDQIRSVLAGGAL